MFLSYLCSDTSSNPDHEQEQCCDLISHRRSHPVGRSHGPNMRTTGANSMPRASDLGGVQFGPEHRSTWAQGSAPGSTNNKNPTRWEGSSIKQTEHTLLTTCFWLRTCADSSVSEQWLFDHLCRRCYPRQTVHGISGENKHSRSSCAKTPDDRKGR